MTGPGWKAVCAALALSVATVSPLLAQPVCKPQMTFAETRFTATQHQQRLWTARIAVDAARCVESHGRFQLGMERVFEYGPDLRFYETFEWRDGVTDIWILLGHDEAPVRHWIYGIAPCRCRD